MVKYISAKLNEGQKEKSMKSITAPVHNLLIKFPKPPAAIRLKAI